MEGVSDRIAPGYGSPPWIFKGSALYQLHLVKADVARSFIPKEVKLVEAFGYTLGGFFLANYDQSPAGVFDELVVIAGIVWNPPTSCAWAARVLVNSEEACSHGRKEVGLPSQVARFSKALTAVEKNHMKENVNAFLNFIGLGTNASSPDKQLNIRVAEVNNSFSADIFDVNLATDSMAMEVGNWGGLPITMSLPSFSGRTPHNPNLLKYACQIQCRVRAVKPAKVTLQANLNNKIEEVAEEDTSLEDGERNAGVLSIMLSRPILALKFSSLRMEVEEPVVVSPDNQ